MSNQENVQSVDDFIMSMVGMGFEVEDAQQAVRMGKLTVEEAIDWSDKEWQLCTTEGPTPVFKRILAGKPPLADQSGSTLRLHQRSSEVPSEPVGSNPFMNPQPIPSSDRAPPWGSQAPPAGDSVGEPEDKVVSRTTMSDEQRKIKDQFEEKQRDEACRLARMEKAAQKKAHAQVLQQIHDDRITQRLRRGGATSAAAPSPAKEAKSDVPETPPGGSRDSPSAEAKPQRCLLQIRLPNGRALRETFQPDTTLRQVWSTVQAKVKVDNNMGFMQPFPRQEYGEEDMGRTLDDLKLTPTGSLVLKKKETPPKQDEMEVEPEVSEGAEASSSTEDPPAPLEDSASAQGVPPVPPLVIGVFGGSHSHNWGAGHKLSDQDQLEEDGEPAAPAPPAFQEDAGMDLGPPGEDSDSDEDMDVGPGMGMGGGGGMGPGWNGGWNAPGHMWGEGQPLMGNVLNPDHLPHHAKDPKQLAADAARRRFADAPSPGPSNEEPMQQVSYDVPKLVNLVIKHVGKRVCDSRQPIVSMQGLPADIAFKILDHLKQEHLLRPKTLHVFISCRIRKLVLDNYLYATNELLHALRLHTNISSLSLASCSLITEKGLSPLKSLKRLKYLNLSSCRLITDNCLPVLQEFESLVTLALEDTKISDVGMIDYVQSKPANLQHLNLNRTAISQNLLLVLHAIPNLKSLSIEYTKVSSLSGVQEMKNLETLNICGTDIGTDSLLCLCSHPTLSALNIAHTANVNGNLALQYIQNLPLQMLELPDRLTTTSLGMQYIAEMPLHTLDLTNYINVTDEGVLHIGRIQSLRRLRLSNTKLSDKGMVYLQGLGQLEELYLDRTSITDVGARIIGEFNQLRELSLSQTSITNATLQEKTLARCPLLSKLNLSRNWISNKGLSCLEHPYLVLLNLDSTKVTEGIDMILRRSCPSLQRVLLANLEPATASEQEAYDL